MGGGPIVDDKPRVKQSYLDNKYKVDKYPYLYAGMKGIRDFQRKYCPKRILKRGNALACNDVPSIDDGDLARRFEKFVRDYSGLDPFDIQYVSSLISTRFHECIQYTLMGWPSLIFFRQPERPGF